MKFEIAGQVVDPIARKIFGAKIFVVNGRINSIEASDRVADGPFILPGFVDSHIHIESSMLLPSQFARAAVLHGTVATVSDPHEIANVCGTDGVELMLRDSAQVNFKFCFGAPSCVPATVFETAGDRIDSEAVARLLDDPRIGYLSEMMNYPGVLSGDPEVLSKIAAAKLRNKPIDGHAPGLKGADAAKYFEVGISTDHECVELSEAMNKIKCGCKIAIREGSAARNFEALKSLIGSHPNTTMLCSDDKHPDELMIGHINRLVARAVSDGYDLMDVLQVACVNPVRHYGLDVGLLQKGDPADFIVVADLNDFEVSKTYIDGMLVAENDRCNYSETESDTLNRFEASPIAVEALTVAASSSTIRVIGIVDGQLITTEEVGHARWIGGNLVSDVGTDVLKLVVLNRYEKAAAPAIGFVKGFGLKKGALASSVAHDSHNIVAVGVDDGDIVAAINAIVETQGGLSLACNHSSDVLGLPVAGLMSTERCEIVAAGYSKLDQIVKEDFGCQLCAPFMTLSFLALPVIPALKLTDLGLFDVAKFEFADLEQG